MHHLLSSKYISSLKITVFCLFLSTYSIAYSQENKAYSLLDVYHLAKQNDATYLQSLANYNSSTEIKSQARSAILPSISLNANEAETEDTHNLTSERSTYSASLDQVLFDYRAYKGLKQARATVSQAEMLLQSAEQSLILRSTQAYLNILAAQDNLRFRQAQKESVKKQLDQSKQRFDVGLIAITDLKEAQANYDLSTAEEISAANTLQTAKEGLLVICNQLIDEVLPLSPDYPLEKLSKNITEWTNIALKNSPTLLAASHQADSLKHAIGFESASRYPRLNFKAERNYIEDSRLSITGEYDTTLSLNLNIPLYQGGNISSRKRSAQYNYEAAYQGYLQETRLTKQLTRNTYSSIQTAISRSKALAQALDSTKAAHEAIEAGYKAGTRTPADLLNATENVFQAENNYAQARYSYILNKFQLYSAAGKLSDSNIQNLNDWLK